jgi:amino acid transporter
MSANEPQPDHVPQHESVELSGLEQGTLSMRRALGLAIVVFSPVLTAATVGTFAGSVAGSSAWLSVLAGTIVVTCIGVAIVPFARRYVVSGALYSYIGHALGNLARLVSGASLAVGYGVGMMAVLGALGVYAGSSLSNTLGLSGANSLVGQALIYIVGIGLAAVLAVRGLDASARLSIWLLVISAPVVIIILVANLFTAGFDFSGQFSFTDFSLSGFIFGIVLSTTFFVGFESSAATALETKDPMRTIPRLMTTVPMIVGGVAVVATLMSVPALPTVMDKVAEGASPIAAMAENAGLGAFAPVADICLAITCFAIVVGFMNYAPRVWATMAADGVLPQSLGRVSPRTHTPVIAIIALAVVSGAFPIILSAVTGDSPLAVYTSLATLFPYLWVIPYVLICIGAIVMLARQRKLHLGVAVAAVLGALGFAMVYVNALLNPTGTSVDAMTWVAPAAVGVALIVMAATSIAARRRNLHSGTAVR